MSLGEGLKGALGGGATGGALGGPLGAVAGGFLGGLGGLFGGGPEVDKGNYGIPGYDQRTGNLQGLAGQYGGRQTPQSGYQGIGQFERAGQGSDNSVAMQNYLMQQLNAQMNGTGPSLANETLRQGLQTGISQQQALAATGRGNPALAGRQAAQNAASMTSGYSGAAAQNRLQEQLNAQGLMAQVSGQARGQDLQASQFDAAQANMRALEQSRGQNQNNQFNVSAYLQGQGQNDQAQLEALRQLFGYDQAQQGGMQAYDAAVRGVGQNPTMGDNLMNTGGQALGFLFGQRK
jgi:hypothetical protein